MAVEITVPDGMKVVLVSSTTGEPKVETPIRKFPRSSLYTLSDKIIWRNIAKFPVQFTLQAALSKLRGLQDFRLPSFEELCDIVIRGEPEEVPYGRYWTDRLTLLVIRDKMRNKMYEVSEIEEYDESLNKVLSTEGAGLFLIRR